jgi:hypothetical protein
VDRPALLSFPRFRLQLPRRDHGLLRGLVMAFAVLVIISPASARGAVPLISYGGSIQYDNGHGGKSTFVARPAFWVSSSWASGAVLHYDYTSTFSGHDDLKAKIDAEMAVLNGTSSGNEAGTWANVPRFYRAASGDTVNIWFTYSGTSPKVLNSGTAGYRYGNTIQINTTQGAAAMAGVVAHEMGHMYGLWHTSMYFGPGPDLSIMAQGIWPKLASWTRYGSCDMAGLQARYGIGEGANSLSSCLPPFGLTAVYTPGNASLTLTSTPSGTTTVYYKDWASTTAYTGTINFDGLCRSTHLYGASRGDLGHGTPSSTSCSWVVSGFGAASSDTFHVGAPGLTAPITSSIAVSV